MSLSFFWRPASPRGTPLDVACPSAFRDTLVAAFGEGPWTLDASADPVLQGIMAATRTDSGAYEELRSAIAKHGAVEIDYA